MKHLPVWMTIVAWILLAYIGFFWRAMVSYQVQQDQAARVINSSQTK